MAISGDELILGAEARLSTEPFKRAAGSLIGVVGGVQAKLNSFSDQSVNTMANVGSSLSQVGGQVIALGSNLQDTGRSMLGAFGSAIQEAGSFEAALDQLKIASGASAQELEVLKQAAITTGVETAFSPQEATQAMFQLASAGLEVNEILAVQRDVLDLVAASGGKIDLATGATLATLANSKLKLELEEVNGFMDQLVRMNQVSMFQYGELESFISRLPTRVGAAQNSTVSSFLAIGSAQRSAGVSASVAGNSIRALFRDLQGIEAQAKKGRGKKFEALEALGLQITDLQDAEGRFLDAAAIVDKITAARTAKGVAGEKAVDAAFTAQSRSLIANIAALEDVITKDGERITGLEALRREFEAQAAGTDLAENAAASFLETWEGIMKLVQGSMDTFKIVMGDTLLPILKVLVSQGLQVFNVFLGWVQASKALRIVLATVVIGLGAMLFFGGAAIVMVGTLVVGLGGLVTAVASTVLAVNALNLSVATLETLLFPLIIAVAALAATFVYLAGVIALSLIPPMLAIGAIVLAWRTNFGGFRDFVEGVFESIGASFRAFHSILTGEALSEEDLHTLGETPSLLNFITNIGMLLFRLQALGRGIRDGFAPAIPPLLAAFSGLSNAVREFFVALAPLIGVDIEKATLGDSATWESVGQIIGQVFVNMTQDTIRFIEGVTTVLTFLSWMITTLQSIPDRLAMLGLWLFEGGSSLMSNFLLGLQTGWGQVEEFFVGKTQWIRDMLPGSEPRNPASPLAGLGMAGAALLGNLALGAQGALPDFQSAMTSNLVSARAALAPVGSLGAPPGSTPGGGAAAAPGGPGAAAAGVSVSIGQIVFSGPVGTSEEEAASLAKMVSDKIADELRVALTDSVAG